MTDPISGRNIPPETQAIYKNEFSRGVKLFEESLAAYTSTPADQAEKKAKFKDVMDKALKIMNQSARGFLNERGQQEEATLEKDYHSYIHSDSIAAHQKVNEDLNHLKEII